MGHTAGRLIGREAPLAQLGDAVARARDGVSTTVLIKADAGIGKSRLVADGLSTFRDPKDAVAVGYGVELAGGAIPYGTVTETLRTLVRDVGVDRVRTAAGAHAAALAPLSPDLGLDDNGSGVDRSRVLPAYVTTFENLASDRLVWLVIEDLHWVDEQSQDLLSYLVRVTQPSRLLVLTTLRTHDRPGVATAEKLVATWSSLEGVDRITLHPLPDGEAAALVTSLTGATDDRVGKVVRLAGGSPLLIEQLAVADLDSPDGAAAVTHPMTMRLDQLGASGRRLAQLASLGDGHLAYHLLEQAFAVPEEFEEAVDQALDAGLLEYRTGTHEFTFTHALLREAAEATLTPTQRLRGHRRWAETLTDKASHAGEAQLRVAAAGHWAESGAETETFASALAAAEVTARLGASKETALLLLRAWQLWDRIPEASVVAARSRDDLLVDTVDALVEASRNLDAMNLLDDEIAASSGEDLYVRRLCLRLARSDARENLGENDDDALYDEALDHIDALTGPHATRLAVSPLSSLAWHLAARHPDQADRVTRQSMELSQQFGHPADIAYTTSMVAYRLSLRGQHAEALAVIGSDLEDEAVRVIDRMQVAMIRADCIGRAGRFREAAARGERTLALVPDPQLAPVQWSFTVMRTCVWLKACGEWTRAAKLYEALSSLINENWITSLWTASNLSLVACDRGDIDEADRLAQQAWDMLPPDEDATLLIIRDGVRLAVAEVAAARGNFDEARAVLMPLVAMPSLEAYADMWPVVAAAARIEGERTHAHDSVIACLAPADATALDAVRSAVERLPRSGKFFAAHYLQANADLARAERADSPETWTAVRDAWRDLEHVPFHAWAALRLAEVQHAADARESAGEALAEAWTLARPLGAQPLTDAITGLARRARLRVDTGGEHAGRAATGRLARLTQRELEVLRHLARGDSNDEVAAALFISPKTASVHVSRILAKLDVTNRSKAAAVAFEEGLDLQTP